MGGIKKLHYLNGFIYDDRNALCGLDYNSNLDFLKTLTDDRKEEVSAAMKALPISVIEVSSNMITKETIMTQFTVIKMVLRKKDSGVANSWFYDYHLVGEEGETAIKGNPIMLLTIEQIRQLNAESVVKMCNESRSKQHKLQVENDFTVKLFQNIKVNTCTGE